MKQKLTCITHMTFDIRRFEAAPFFLETKHIRTIDNKLLINNFKFRWDICRYQYVFKYVLIKIYIFTGFQISQHLTKKKNTF